MTCQMMTRNVTGEIGRTQTDPNGTVTMWKGEDTLIGTPNPSTVMTSSDDQGKLTRKTWTSLRHQESEPVTQTPQ